MKKQRVAIIGLGSWAEKIVRTLKTFEDVEIVAACQRKNERPDWLPECQLFHDVGDLLVHTALTHIITAVPPQAHLDIISTAQWFHRPIWLEKPIALSLEDAKAIFSGVGSLFVDHIHLYSECWQYMLNEVKPKIQSGSIIRSTGYGFGPNPSHDFSVLYDYAVHDLSMLFTLFDDVKVENTHLTKGSNGEHYSIEMKANECSILTKVGNDGCYGGKKRLFDITIGDDTYSYDGLAQTVSKNGDVVFKAKELPLKHALSAFLSGEQSDRPMVLKMMKLLGKIEERTMI